jgi:hypothetical protein
MRRTFQEICMSKLRRIRTPELDRLEGYLSAAQHVFFKGELEVRLDAALFEITSNDISDEEVVLAAYPDGFNPIEHRAACSIKEMMDRVNNILSITKAFWKPEYSARERVEDHLREGYWQHVKSCFDYTYARIVELGHNVPYVNIGGGFTYILYAADMSRCLVLMGNTCD